VVLRDEPWIKIQGTVTRLASAPNWMALVEVLWDDFGHPVIVSPHCLRAVKGEN
jgi:CTP:molybdopterin cytidylyltransferase MocA